MEIIYLVNNQVKGKIVFLFNMDTTIVYSEIAEKRKFWQEG